MCQNFEHTKLCQNFLLIFIDIIYLFIINPKDNYTHTHKKYL